MYYAPMGSMIGQWFRTWMMSYWCRLGSTAEKIGTKYWSVLRRPNNSNCRRKWPNRWL